MMSEICGDYLCRDDFSMSQLFSFFAQKFVQQKN